MAQQEELFRSPPEHLQAGRVIIDPNYDNRSILTETSGFIRDYDYTLNPYSGCAFGCQYCYAASFVAGPKADGPDTPFNRENWGNWVRVKKNAVNMVAKAVREGKLNGKSIYMSSVTDPYQPTERRTGQTRQLLAELAKVPALGLVIQTRGPLVDNDEDIALCRQIIANGGYVQVNMTITTNDEGVRRACEPTCPSYRQRLDAITSLHQKTDADGRYTTCITMSPLLPTDEPRSFAADLAASGIRRFIIQPTHTGKPNPGRFRAATRNEIVHQLAQYWECSPESVPVFYQEAYQEAVKVIVPVLQKADALIGFGQPGFGRPWLKDWHTDLKDWPPYLVPADMQLSATH